MTYPYSKDDPKYLQEIPLSTTERLNRMGIKWRIEKIDYWTWRAILPDEHLEYWSEEPYSAWEALLINLRRKLIFEGRITLEQWPKIME